MPVQNRIQFRRGTAAVGALQWTNQVLYAGEVGYETDTGRFKIGDGITSWDNLAYASVLPSSFSGVSGIAVSTGANGSTLSIAVSGITSSQINDFASAVDARITAATLDVEQIQDVIGSGLAGGSGIQTSYDDSLGIVTISATGLSFVGHTHDDRYYTETELNTSGGGGQVHWNNITNTPSGFTPVSHTHTSSQITDFNSSVSGLLPVKNVSAGSGISVSSSNGDFTVSLSDPSIESTDVTDFAEAVDDRVSNLLVAGTGITLNYNDGSNTLSINSSFSSLGAGSGIAVAVSGGQYTVSLSDPTIQVSDITDLTVSAEELNYLDGSIPGTGVAGKAVVLDAGLNIANLGNVSTTGTLTVGGNLIVNGQTTTVNSTVTTIDDPIITLGGDVAPSTNDSKDRGVEFRWHDGTSAKLGFFGYDNSTGKFTFIPNAANTNESFTGDLGELDAYIDWGKVNNKPDPIIAVNLTGDVTGSGNATLTDLANGNISISTSISADSVVLGTDTTGDYVSTVSVSGVGLSSSGSGESASVVITSNATSSNTANTVVSRDASGNFSAGTITATFSGDGSSVTGINATNISTGTLSSDRLSANIPVTKLASSGITLGSTTVNLGQTSNRIDHLVAISGQNISNPTTLTYCVIDGGTP